MSDLNALVSDVAVARKALAAIKDEISAKRLAFEASLADLYTANDEAVAAVNTAESAARDAALAAFDADPENKKPHPALGIRVSTEINFDEPEATRWAIQHDMPSLLKLDRSAFKKLLKAGAVEGLDTAEETVITATIASDLSAYLAEAADD